MIRFGLVFSSDPGSWLGGLNYFQNLLGALDYLDHRRVTPVLFAAPRFGDQVRSAFPEFEVIEAGKAIDLSGRGRVRRLIDRDARLHRLFWRRLFEKHEISMLSHTNILGDTGGVPMAGWLYDLQHRVMPELFSDADRAERDRDFESTCRYCRSVIVSSNAAASDASRYFPRCSDKLERLPFVVNTARTAATPVADVQARYGIRRPYFYFPGQFWIHKGHATTIEALKLLAQKGKMVRLVCSGGHHDYRNPDYYPMLMKQVADDRLDGFTSLGPIPYADVLGLMSGAMAVVNPSLFEGWNTGVEEAKSLGKAVVLSDIPVHREQSPERAWYFRPNDAEGLATALAQAADSYDVASDQAHLEAAKNRLLHRLRKFAAAYQAILLRTAGIAESQTGETNSRRTD